MRLEDAVKQSGVGSAYRSYYSGMMSPLKNKYIVVRGMYEDTYTVWADTFKYIAPLDGSETHKVLGRTDWEPVDPPGWKTVPVDF